MSEAPCGREDCEFVTEVFGEADSSDRKCLYPGAEWEKVNIDQSLECEPCMMLAIHCRNLIDVNISRSSSKKIKFRLHGTYHRPANSDDLYMAFQVSKDLRWPYNLIIQGPGYICEAFQADGLRLDISIPDHFVFSTLVINAKSIHSSIPLKAKDRIRLQATADIVCKLCSPKIWAKAQTGICLTCEAFNRLTEADISCRDYVEVTLSGYDSYYIASPIPQHYIRNTLRATLCPTVFRGNVLSGTGDTTIYDQVFA